MTDHPHDNRATADGTFDDLMSLVAGIVHLPEDERDLAIARFCQEHPGEDPDALRGAVDEALRREPAVPTPAEERLRRLKLRPPAAERYTLRGEVARGGMGVILKAYDQDLGRNLAMKVILGHGEDASGQTPPVDQKVLARFLDEAQVTGQLDHPGVVPVHELGLDPEGRVYFTMRLVKGRTAHEIFALAREKRDGWTLTKALEVVLKICDTLAYAHDKGVIHRDLKPQNVMVGRFGEVYVMDWGLAKVLGQKEPRDLRIKPESTDSRSRVRTDRSKEAESDPDSPLVTMDGAVVGTPSYMSPEQAEGRVEELDARTDVYAVGACLYTLLTGQQPYLKPGTRASAYTILNAVRHGPPQPVHEIDRTIPAELVAICDKAMARDRRTRYAGMQALAEDLRAYLGDRVVKAHRTGAIAELSKWVKRNRAAAATCVAILVLASASPLAWRHYRDLGLAKQRHEEQSAMAAAGSSFEDRERIAPLVARLTQRILAGLATPEDCFTLASNHVRSTIHAAPFQARSSVTATLRIETLLDGGDPRLGLLLVPQVSIDGVVTPLEKLMAWLVGGDHALISTMPLAPLPAPSGRHTIQGSVDVHFVDRSGRGLEGVSLWHHNYQLDEVAPLLRNQLATPVRLRLEPRTITVLEDMPGAFPVVLTSGPLAEAFIAGIRVSACVASDPHLPAERGVVRTTVQLPVTVLWAPLRLGLEAGGQPLETEAFLTLRHDDISSSGVGALPTALSLGPDAVFGEGGGLNDMDWNGHGPTLEVEIPLSTNSVADQALRDGKLSISISTDASLLHDREYASICLGMDLEAVLTESPASVRRRLPK